MKKRYRFSLAIVVPQRGGHLHSGDRLFEWPKLSGKKMTNESTYGEICNSASRQKCVLRCTQIFHNLIGWTCIVCILFALQRLFHDFNHFTTFFPCKTDEKVRGTFGLKFSKLDSFLEPSLWRTIEFIGEFLQVRLKILHLYASQTIGQFELSLYYEVSQKYL